jgi:hypothetical protein
MAIRRKAATAALARHGAPPRALLDSLERCGDMFG